MATDDSGIRYEPSRHVDYLSHDWKESDISSSWRYVILRRKDVANSARLENASWRTWTKAKYNLSTVSPESVNWLKDYDVTWLYGPLLPRHQLELNAKKQQKSPKNSFSSPSSATSSSVDLKSLDYFSSPSPSSDPNNHQNHPPTAAATRPILKKRSVSEIILARTMMGTNDSTDYYDHHHHYNNDGSNENHSNLDDNNTVASKNSITNSHICPQTTLSPNDLKMRGRMRTSPALLSPSATPSPARHIHFNDRVEQCIALDEPTQESYTDDDYTSSSDDDDHNSLDIGSEDDEDVNVEDVSQESKSSSSSLLKKNNNNNNKSGLQRRAISFSNLNDARNSVAGIPRRSGFVRAGSFDFGHMRHGHAGSGSDDENDDDDDDDEEEDEEGGLFFMVRSASGSFQRPVENLKSRAEFNRTTSSIDSSASSATSSKPPHHHRSNSNRQPVTHIIAKLPYTTLKEPAQDEETVIEHHHHLHHPHPGDYIDEDDEDEDEDYDSDEDYDEDDYFEDDYGQKSYFSGAATQQQQQHYQTSSSNTVHNAAPDGYVYTGAPVTPPAIDEHTASTTQHHDEPQPSDTNHVSGSSRRHSSRIKSGMDTKHPGFYYDIQDDDDDNSEAHRQPAHNNAVLHSSSNSSNSSIHQQPPQQSPAEHQAAISSLLRTRSGGFYGKNRRVFSGLNSSDEEEEEEDDDDDDASSESSDDLDNINNDSNAVHVSKLEYADQQPHHHHHHHHHHNSSTANSSTANSTANSSSVSLESSGATTTMSSHDISSASSSSLELPRHGQPLSPSLATQSVNSADASPLLVATKSPSSSSISLLQQQQQQQQHHNVGISSSSSSPLISRDGSTCSVASVHSEGAISAKKEPNHLHGKLQSASANRLLNKYLASPRYDWEKDHPPRRLHPGDNDNHHHHIENQRTRSNTTTPTTTTESIGSHINQTQSETSLETVSAVSHDTLLAEHDELNALVGKKTDHDEDSTTTGVKKNDNTDDNDSDPGAVGKFTHAVNTAKDIIHLVWNVGWTNNSGASSSSGSSSSPSPSVQPSPPPTQQQTQPQQSITGCATSRGSSEEEPSDNDVDDDNNNDDDDDDVGSRCGKTILK